MQTAHDTSNSVENGNAGTTDDEVGPDIIWDEDPQSIIRPGKTKRISRGCRLLLRRSVKQEHQGADVSNYLVMRTIVKLLFS